MFAVPAKVCEEPLWELIDAIPEGATQTQVEFEVWYCNTLPFEQFVNATSAMSNNDEPALLIARQTNPAPSACAIKMKIDITNNPRIMIIMVAKLFI
ncbi:MAG: hypothetical protein EB166_08165 [Thaumarchaeota archaeon]|nr:hypothetical protein [Nitrososphaerota archaeon]